MATVGEIHIRIEEDSIDYSSTLTIPEIVLFLEMTKAMILKTVLESDNIKENDGTQAG